MAYPNSFVVVPLSVISDAVFANLLAFLQTVSATLQIFYLNLLKKSITINF